MIYLMRYSLILLIRNLQVDEASLELRVNKNQLLSFGCRHVNLSIVNMKSIL